MAQAFYRKVNMNEQGFFIFDVETSTLYNDKLAVDHKEQAWIVEFACVKVDKNLKEIGAFSSLMQPPFPESIILPEATAIHGISIEDSITKGIPYHSLYAVLKPVFDGNFKLVGHNVGFDFKFLHMFPKTHEERINLAKASYTGICTMKNSIDYCKLPPTASMIAKGMKTFKSPKLAELFKCLFNEDMEEAHHAGADVRATLKCLRELVKIGVIVL